jgi:hypothetical protein
MSHATAMVPPRIRNTVISSGMFIIHFHIFLLCGGGTAFGPAY